MLRLFRSNNPTSLSEPGRPAKPKTTVKFETEYDFEQAIVEFKDMIDKFEVGLWAKLRSLRYFVIGHRDLSFHIEEV